MSPLKSSTVALMSGSGVEVVLVTLSKTGFGDMLTTYIIKLPLFLILSAMIDESELGSLTNVISCFGAPATNTGATIAAASPSTAFTSA